MKVVIKSGGLGCNTEIEVDGKRLDCVRSVRFECDGPGPALVTLECYVDEIEIAAEVDPTIVPIAVG